MNLKQLCDVVDGLRARGVHPLTDVVIVDMQSTLTIGRISERRGRIEIVAEYQDDPHIRAGVEDDE